MFSDLVRAHFYVTPVGRCLMGEEDVIYLTCSLIRHFIVSLFYVQSRTPEDGRQLLRTRYQVIMMSETLQSEFHNNMYAEMTALFYLYIYLFGNISKYHLLQFLHEYLLCSTYIWYSYLK